MTQRGALSSSARRPVVDAVRGAMIADSGQTHGGHAYHYGDQLDAFLPRASMGDGAHTVPSS